MKTLIPMQLIAAAAVLAASAPAGANPLDAFGFGARSIALGGAATASVDDFSANYYNPAALGLGEEMRLELGYALSAPRMEINGRDLAVDESRAFQGGLTLPGRILGRKVAVSAGIHLPDARITRVRALPQTQPRFVLYDNRPQRLVITTSAAVEVVEDVFVGAGLTYLSHTGGTVEIDGIVSASDAGDTRLFSGVDVSLPAVRYPTFGVLWRRGGWKLAASWREEFSLDIDLELNVRGDVVFGEDQIVVAEDGAFTLRTITTTLFSPRQASVGASYEAGGWLVSADLSWLQWSAFPSPTARVNVGIDVPGLPLEIPPTAQPEAPGFSDILVPRVGVQYQAVDGPNIGVALRGGYFFEASPAPDQPGRTNFIDSDKHGVSVGVGLRLSDFTAVLKKPLLIDFAVQSISLVERDYLKDDPADKVGDYRADGQLLGGSLTCKLLF